MNDILKNTNKSFKSIIIHNLSSSNSTIHIRPLFDGCNQLVRDIFIPVSFNDFKRLKTFPKKCQLNGRTLKVSVHSIPPFCSLAFNFNNKSTQFSWKINDILDSTLLKILQKRFNFKSELIDTKRVFGYLDSVSGKWNGTVGLLANGVRIFIILIFLFIKLFFVDS